ncbi:hypothetical protein T492DRAFT_881058 [Pavlovales sp. CCMP2436]|nr:hypothetical protein T492DRAFT_881058 [Pavlovales sp. CCMP2436]
MAGRERPRVRDEDKRANEPADKPERRFPCDEPGCAYSATRIGTLNKHKRTHSGERPYIQVSVARSLDPLDPVRRPIQLQPTGYKKVTKPAL